MYEHFKIYCRTEQTEQFVSRLNIDRSNWLHEQLSINGFEHFIRKHFVVMTFKHLCFQNKQGSIETCH